MHTTEMKGNARPQGTCFPKANGKHAPGEGVCENWIGFGKKICVFFRAKKVPQVCGGLRCFLAEDEKLRFKERTVMKTLLMLACALSLVQCFGQGLLRTRGLRDGRAERAFRTMYPEGTNEFGRTYQQQSDFDRQQLDRRIAREKFEENYPGGKDEFGRSFDEQYEHVKTFDLDSFLGFKLGKAYAGDKTVKLAKPFRLFDSARLETTVMGRLYRIELKHETDGVSIMSLSNEWTKIESLLARTYKLPRPDGMFGSKVCWWTSSLGVVDVFENDVIKIRVDWSYMADSGRGNICIMVEKRGLREQDAKERADEIAKEIESKNKTLSVADNDGADMLTTVDGVVAQTRNDAENKTGTSLRLKSATSSRRMLGGLVPIRRNEEIESARAEAFPRYQKVLKEITGYEMGQRVFEELSSGFYDKAVKLEKPYRYFSSCEFSYVDGCICGIGLRFESNGMYSMKSLDAEALATRKDLSERFGFSGIMLEDPRRRGSPDRNGWLVEVYSTPENGGEINVRISDCIIDRQLNRQAEEKRERGKKDLPIFGVAK